MASEPKRPKVYCWINSGKGTDWIVSCAMAEDGTSLAHHVSSSEAWAKRDIGYMADDGPGEAKRREFAEHYPNGYEMEWVDSPREHAGLMAAHERNQAQRAESAEVPADA